MPVVKITPTMGFVIEGRAGSTATTIESFGLKEDETDQTWETAVSIYESMVLAHFNAGVDVTAPSYRAGLEVSVNAAAQLL